MGGIEQGMFGFLEAIGENRFGEAAEILKEAQQICDQESFRVLEGFMFAAMTLEAMQKEEFHKVEKFWLRYEESKRFLNSKNRYYSIFLEISLVIEDIKEEMDNII